MPDLKSTKATYEHVKMLWEDQVQLAETLRDKRKTISPLLALLVGLGLFRLDFRKSPTEVLIVSEWELYGMVASLTLAGLLFLAGAYFLFTERPLFRRLLHWVTHCTVRRSRWLIRNFQTLEPVKVEVAPESRWPSGRAISHILPDEERLEDWFVQTEESIWVVRTERLRVAYMALRTQNLRVNGRLKNGVMCLILGYAAVFFAFFVYLVSFLSEQQ